ncbi:MAG: tRNA (N6-isopentenyl adenosine(37)-C2)-methylthiotransferase MiaB, partial [Planctomycetota bacterium]
GFPGETDEDYQQTRELLEYVRYKNSFIFKYSPRPGTAAYDRIPDDVPDAVKRQRNNDLLALQTGISTEIHQSYIGETVEVFVEGVSQKSRKQAPESGEASERVQLSGRTGGDLITFFEGDPSLVGQMVRIKVETAFPLALLGKLED